jgi:hypothetical protein
LHLRAQELVLTFKSGTAAASADAASTVLTAAASCGQLQQLCVGGSRLGLRSIPGSLAALKSLVKLGLKGCSLEGTLQLPRNLVNLGLDDCTAHKLPTSLSTMSSLTQLIVISAAAPPPAWPPNLQVLKVLCPNQKWFSASCVCEALEKCFVSTHNCTPHSTFVNMCTAVQSEAHLLCA